MKSKLKFHTHYFDRSEVVWAMLINGGIKPNQWLDLAPPSLLALDVRWAFHYVETI